LFGRREFLEERKGVAQREALECSDGGRQWLRVHVHLLHAPAATRHCRRMVHECAALHVSVNTCNSVGRCVNWRSIASRDSESDSAGASSIRPAARNLRIRSL
jgi:hypothetical protein